MKIKQGICLASCGMTNIIEEDNSLSTGAHLIHLVLTLLTGFLWGVIWIIHANCSSSKWRCTKCGSVVK